MQEQQTSSQLLAKYVPPGQRTPALQQCLAGAIARRDEEKIQKFIEWASANYPQGGHNSIVYIDASVHVDVVSGNDFSSTVDSSTTDNSTNIESGFVSCLKFLLLLALMAGVMEYATQQSQQQEYRYSPTSTNHKQ